ncbi:MAG: sugar phosphate isomerase/epimerase [Betaproteobacteria bacterium]|nr:MAG: sugar phosphate isomerase/epimerase [Betaproteobacteria bacterium]
MTTRALGLAALTVLELPHHEQVTVAAQAGYSHVGLRLRPVAGQPYEYPVDLPAIKARLADTGVRVLDVEVFRLSADTEVAQFEPVICVAAELGAAHLLVHGADADEARLTDNFARLCDLAGRYRLIANLEPMPWVDVSTIAKALAVLRRAGRANSGLLVDAIHFFRAGDRVAALPSLPGQYLHYAQFCDARRERPADMQEIIRQARSDRLMPGEGGLDLHGLLRALPGALPLSLEVPYAKPMPALERARRARESTLRLLEQS